eukprot:6151198-Pyramimonas_sp.AAC.1
MGAATAPLAPPAVLPLPPPAGIPLASTAVPLVATPPAATAPVGPAATAPAVTPVAPVWPRVDACKQKAPASTLNTTTSES